MIAIAPDVSSIQDNDGAVVLDIRRNRITTLNAVGAYVWKRLEGGMRVEQIVDQLALDADMPHDTVTTEVSAFIDDLIADQLLISHSSNKEAGV